MEKHVQVTQLLNEKKRKQTQFCEPQKPIILITIQKFLPFISYH